MKLDNHPSIHYSTLQSSTIHFPNIQSSKYPIYIQAICHPLRSHNWQRKSSTVSVKVSERTLYFEKYFKLPILYLEIENVWSLIDVHNLPLIAFASLALEKGPFAAYNFQYISISIPRRKVYGTSTSGQGCTNFGLSSLSNFLKILSLKCVYCAFRDKMP